MGDMTIKQKARVAWERDLEVKLDMRNRDPINGKVARCDHNALEIDTEFGNWPVFYTDITDIRFVDEPPEEVQDEPVAVGQFVYMKPGAGRRVVGLVCDSALVNGEGKLVIHTYWPGEHHIAGMAGRLDVDFAESIFGYHGGTVVYEVLVRGCYADITFTIDDPQESQEDVPGLEPPTDKESEQTFRFMDAFNFEGGKEVRRAVYTMIVGETAPLQARINELDRELHEPTVMSADEPCEEPQTRDEYIAELEEQIEHFKEIGYRSHAEYEKLKAENAELKRSLSELVAADEESTAETCVDSVREELTHAQMWDYPVMCVSVKSEHGGLSTSVTGRIRSIVTDSAQYEGREYVTFWDESSVFLDTIASVIIMYGDAPEESKLSDEPHDMAKERWGWRGLDVGEVLVRLDLEESMPFVDSPEQKALQAAAPVLADMTRGLLTIANHAVLEDDDWEARKHFFYDSIRLLRKLGVPNVAPWYKGDE